MVAQAVTAGDVDLADIQGLVLSSWKEHDRAVYLFVRFGAADEARRWLAGIKVSKASDIDFKSDRCGGPPRVQVALTASGMALLGATTAAMAAFSDEAKQGMAARARLLGDGDDDASLAWQLMPAGTRVDALVLLYASGTAIDTLVTDHEAAIAAAGGTVVSTERSAELSPQEHFGFADGLSQPRIAGMPGSLKRTGGSEIPRGEVLLGYQNGYGFDPFGPKDGAVDLGKNGTYLVFRKLEQDVVAFWTYFRDQARELTAAGHGPGPSATAADLERWSDYLAAKVVGRWRNGASLVHAPHAEPAGPVDLVQANRFDFLPGDRDGYRCPLGSHVRRANPRSGRGGEPEESRLVVDRHRVLRRGRNYGPMLDRERAIRGETDGERRGLLFICLQASIARGFEFVQQTWLSNPGFSGLVGETDPIAGGERAVGSDFTIPAHPVPIRLKAMKRFVTTRGGGYFFLPSVSALRYLADPRSSSEP